MDRINRFVSLIFSSKFHSYFKLYGQLLLIPYCSSIVSEKKTEVNGEFSLSDKKSLIENEKFKR